MTITQEATCEIGDFEIGDMVLVPVTVYRKWRQFWIPRKWSERHVYQVTGVITK